MLNPEMDNVCSACVLEGICNLRGKPVSTPNKMPANNEASGRINTIGLPEV